MWHVLCMFSWCTSFCRRKQGQTASGRFRLQICFRLLQMLSWYIICCFREQHPHRQACQRYANASQRSTWITDSGSLANRPSRYLQGNAKCATRRLKSSSMTRGHEQEVNKWQAIESGSLVCEYYCKRMVLVPHHVFKSSLGRVGPIIVKLM